MRHVYFPYNAEEVAMVLAIEDCDEILGVNIAFDMLAGKIDFTYEEIQLLAAARDVTSRFMIENDPAFKRYNDTTNITKITIAHRLILSGAEVEFAAEICGLHPDTVRSLVD